MAESGRRARHQLANHRVPSIWEALLLTAAAAVLPGVAHLYAGMRRTGTALLAAYGLVVGAAVVTVMLHPGVVAPGHSPEVTLAAGVLGGVWGVVVIWSYVLLRPPGMSLTPRLLSGAAAALICLTVGLPALAMVGDQGATSSSPTTLTGRTQNISPSMAPSSMAPAPVAPRVTPRVAGRHGVKAHRHGLAAHRRQGRKVTPVRDKAPGRAAAPARHAAPPARHVPSVRHRATARGNVTLRHPRRGRPVVPPRGFR